MRVDSAKTKQLTKVFTLPRIAQFPAGPLCRANESTNYQLLMYNNFILHNKMQNTKKLKLSQT
jgi:hypothetical protein